MTTQVQMRADVKAFYAFLKSKATGKGLIYMSQESMAAELKYSIPRVHRLVQKLIGEKKIKISGGGRAVKVMQLVSREKFEEEEEVPPPSPARIEKALSLMDALEAAMRKTG